MSTQTTHFDLVKPAQTDGYDVAVQNGNMDIIDAEMYKPPLTVNGIEPDPETRNIPVNTVPYADNLTSDIAQTNTGVYIERTSGGGSPVSSGTAFLAVLKGNSVHTGQVAQSITMTVTPVPRTEGDAPITATIDEDTFVSYVPSSGTITLTYTTEWNANPANYGITVTGTPVDGDVITVVYVKANRGTITNPTPNSFNATGWNLYSTVTGYAKVIHYSNQYGYKIGGSYSIVEFSTTIGGTRETISVSTGGYFNVGQNGYIFVTGGNSTTYVYPTWSDWVTSYEGDFESYTVDTIDLSEVMLMFPYGLLSVGDVKDEININAGYAVNRIQRLTYNQDNLDSVIASGVPYDADTNYIYAVIEDPTPSDINLDGEYTVNDHGIEYFTGTTIAVDTEILYTDNLKDKLRTDVLTISEQVLSATQKLQVQTNLGLIPTQTAKTVEGYVIDARALTVINSSIALLNSLFNGLLKVATYTKSYSLNANANTSLKVSDFTSSVPSGYTPVAVRAFSSGTADVIPYAVYPFNFTSNGGNKNAMSLKNNSNSDKSGVTATIAILYAKDSIVV